MTEDRTSSGPQRMVSVGGYLAERLHQLGVTDVFAVPGDYNLALLDELLKDERLAMIGCCNELNAGYAADGYARARGVGVVITTFSVGALSAINAIAGAHAENLPVLLVSGGPNTRSKHEHELLHHTIDTTDTGYQRQMFEHVTACAVTIDHLEDAAAKIDEAIRAAIDVGKPAYIEIAANLAAREIPAPEPMRFGRATSDADALDAAIAAVAEVVDAARKPVLLAGSQLRSFGAIEAFADLADASGYAVAVMPDAKGFVSEQRDSFIGGYWGPIGDPGVASAVEAADVVLAVGPVFTDYTTVGHSCLLSPDRLVVIGPRQVSVKGRTFSGVAMADVLAGLSAKVAANPTSLETFRRTQRPLAAEPGVEASDAVTARVLAERVEAMLTPTTTLIAETGDSWFHATKMRLPEGASFEIQMKYGSIGWSVGAALGAAVAGGGDRQVVAMIGDGSFQMTAQEVSTMVRLGVPVTLFVVNNGGYTIEVEIHDGPYNVIQDWRYAELIDVFSTSGGPATGVRVTTVGELDAAVAQAAGAGGVNLIEVVIDRDDCSDELLDWGSRVLANNTRAPHDTIIL